MDRPSQSHSDRPMGPGLASLLSAGLGVFVMGLFTTLASGLPGVKYFMNWWSPGGPLTGKTGLGVIAWLLSWLILHALWRKREGAFGRVWVLTLVLLGLGALLMFPPIFEAFERR